MDNTDEAAYCLLIDYLYVTFLPMMLSSPAPRTDRPSRESPSLTSVGFLLHLAQSRLYKGVAEAVAGSGLHGGQLAVLGALADMGEMSQRQLGEVAQIEKSSLVLFLDLLEAGGWVKRGVNPHDRRAHCVRLTAKGAAEFRKLGPALKKVQDRFLSPLTAAERVQLVDLLQRLGGG
ncbi:MAG: MarR family winged helix-turn-helix transcriptional regulator [Rhizomicrobium sp.]